MCRFSCFFAFLLSFPCIYKQEKEGKSKFSVAEDICRELHVTNSFGWVSILPLLHRPYARKEIFKSTVLAKNNWAWL